MLAPWRQARPGAAEAPGGSQVGRSPQISAPPTWGDSEIPQKIAGPEK